jgi:acyl-CoA thioester hydrolase
MQHDWIEMARNTVRAWQCDHLGHMNVQFYIARLADAGMLAMNGLGLTVKEADARRINAATVSQKLEYRRELRAGDLIAIESRILEQAGKKLRLAHRLRNVVSGDICFEAEVLYVGIDLDARRSVDLPVGLPPLPPLPDGLPPLTTERSCIQTWECDLMGHMNIQFYMSRATAADAHVALALGVEPARLRADGGGFTPVSHRILFRRELHSGGSTLIRSGVRGVDGDIVRWHHDIRDPETGAQGAVFETAARYIDMKTGAPLPLPEAVRSRAGELAAQWTPPPLPKPLTPALPEAPPPGAVDTFRGAFESWELDHFGRPAPQFYMPRFITGAQLLTAHFGWPFKARLARGWGSAALDYEIRYHRPPADGETLVARSGFVALGDKASRFCHWFTGSDSDEVHVSADVTTVWFDLKARRAVPLPAEFRAVVEPHLLLPPAP